MSNNPHTGAGAAGPAGTEPNLPYAASPGGASASPSASRRVLIVEDDTLVGMGLKTQLEHLGHTVVGHAWNARQAAELYREKRPDVVLVDIRLGDDDGIALAAQLFRERRCPMLVLSAYSERSLVERAGAAGAFGYLIKPVSGESLQAQMEVAVRRFREFDDLLREKQELAATLETRKLVERAKGIYMKHLKLDEPEAHRRLQQESQKRRVSLADLARKIIESEELLGGG